MSFDLAITNSDLKISPNGDIKTVSDTDKLRQDILKIILTSLGSNRFHPWYGCAVTDNVIGKNLSDRILMHEIESSITNSLKRLKLLQDQQATTQKVSLSELISSIGSVVVSRSDADYRQLTVDVTVYTRRLTVVEETFTLIL